MKSTIFVAAGLSLLLMGSCNTMKNNNKTIPADRTTESAVQASASKGEKTPSLSAFTGEWSIIELDGKQVNVNGENHPILTFEPETSQPGVLNVMGFNGCNYINGAWKVENGKIQPAGEFITSLKACADAPYEQAVNSALNNVALCSFIGSRDLSLMSATGRVVMKLRKQSLDFINGAWKVTVIEDRDIKAAIKIVIDTNEGRVHGNAGCNILNGTIIVNYDKGQGIEFRDLATSRMTCPDIAEEQTFLLALEQVASASKGNNPDTAYLCNQAGQKIITLKRLAADELVEE